MPGRQLLAYAGKRQFELHTVDLSAVVTDLEQLLQTSASSRVSLEFDLAAELPTTQSVPITIEARPTRRWTGDGVALVIDDDSAIRRVVSGLARALGFDPIQAPDGVTGVEMFRERSAAVRVVLLDLTMPKMSGAAVFEELRKIRPEVPIILMSGFSEESGHFAGGDLAGFLQKPFRLDEMHETVRVALEPLM